MPGTVLFLVFLVTSTTLLSGQKTLVSPAGLANREGTDNTSGLTGDQYGSTCFLPHCQFINEELRGRPMVISAVAFRRDGHLNGPCYDQPLTITYTQVTLSTTPVAAAAMTSSWAGNHGANRTRVLANASYQWAGQSRPTTAPAPFHYRLLFTTPFTHTGKGNLCLETEVGRLGSPPLFECHWCMDQDKEKVVNNCACCTPLYPYSYCYATGRSSPARTSVEGRGTVVDGAVMWQMSWGGTDFPAGVNVVCLVGNSTSRWGSLLLPLNLRPWLGNYCALHTNPVVWLISKTKTDNRGRLDPAGETRLLTADPALLDTDVHFQGIALDAGRLSPVPMITSQAQSLRWIAMPVVQGTDVGCYIYGGRISGTNYVHGPDGPFEGTVVTEFTYR